eukprot:jgi/Chlat1/6834/Chrsp51S06525
MAAAASTTMARVTVRPGFLAGSPVAPRARVAPVQLAPARLSVRADAAPPAKRDRSKDTLWFASPQSLAYLDGSLPGDFGFDPLGLSDPEGAGGFVDPAWLRYGEIINGRFAMLGVAGILAPEVFGKLGIIPESTRLVWFKAGAVPPQGSYPYWADSYTLFWVMIILFNFVEVKRWADYQKPGSQATQYFLGLEGAFKGTGDAPYPGGPFFNPLNYPADQVNKTKEIKNGRLAMIAFLGFAVQAMVTGKGPVENLLDHLSDPFNNNILTNFGRIPPLSFPSEWSHLS